MARRRTKSKMEVSLQAFNLADTARARGHQGLYRRILRTLDKYQANMNKYNNEIVRKQGLYGRSAELQRTVGQVPQRVYMGMANG